MQKRVQICAVNSPRLSVDEFIIGAFKIRVDRWIDNFLDYLAQDYKYRDNIECEALKFCM